MPNHSRRRSLRPVRIDGLKLRITDGPALTETEFARALRMLARMMVRGHHDAHRDGHAIALESKPPFDLTVAPGSRPVDSDEAA